MVGRRDLIWCCVGPASLHGLWVDGGVAQVGGTRASDLASGRLLVRDVMTPDRLPTHSIPEKSSISAPFVQRGW